ncbi:MAG: type II toxin-antitoxin system RelB/DinJ family antitoxin [Bacilli bacterium]|nr:type II toxin-antitoxin system RelB/DinJ family antitoxin [Bacilli bacterium]
MSNIPNTTNLNVRVDSTLKQESDMLFKNLGLNMSTAINMFLTKCVKTSSIPFKIEEPKPSKEFAEALKEVDYMMKHPEKYKKYNSVEELFEDLDIND